MSNFDATTDDGKVFIDKEELALLRKIAETSFDLLMGKSSQEFRELNGSQNELDKAHSVAVFEHDKWLSDNPNDCRDTCN